MRESGNKFEPIQTRKINAVFVIEGGITIPRSRFGTGFGQAKFPTPITNTTRLGEPITVDSRFVFKILDMDTEFLHEPVDHWPGFPSFLSSKAKTVAFNIVNDSAERGVKLSSDYLDAARSEEHFQNILQVVEADRKQTPSLRKRKRLVDDGEK